MGDPIADDQERIPEKMPMGPQFRDCPYCGHEDGFHSMFRREGPGNELSWMLICPCCHRIFDIGLKASLDE